jgi:hypothetical protein
MNITKYKIPRHHTFLHAAGAYFKEGNELLFFTAAGLISGEISVDGNLHFDKVLDLSDELVSDILNQNPNCIKPDGNDIILLKNVTVYPNGIPSEQAVSAKFPELALFVDQIISVSAFQK